MDEITRTDRLLAYLLLERMDGRSQEYRALRVSKAGFSNREIADLLETSAPTVAQMLYTARIKSKSPKTLKAKAVPRRTVRSK
jgi:DNA-directed RNA polymerase specialized sigma24 family protein